MKSSANLKRGDRMIRSGVNKNTEIEQHKLKEARTLFENGKRVGERDLTIKYRNGIPQVVSVI